MAKPDDIGGMVSDVFNPHALWQCFSDVAKVMDMKSFSSDMGKIMGLAVSIGFILFMIQFVVIVYTSIKNNANLLREVAQLIFKIAVIGVIISPPVYPYMVKWIFAAPADATAETITQIYNKEFMESVADLWGSYTKADDAGIIKFIKGTLDGSLVVTFISSIVWIAAAIFLFITPILQGLLFLYLFYAGPLCLVFAFCDFTTQVAKAWVSLTLTIAWLGVFGSLSFLVAHSMNVISHMSATGPGWENLFPMIVYSIVSLILFCAAFPVTSFFFGTIGALPNVSSPTAMVGGAAGAVTAGAAATAASGMAMGGAMKGTGKLLEMFGGGGLGNVGRDLVGAGNEMISAGGKAFGVAEPKGRFGAQTIASAMGAASTPAQNRPSQRQPMRQLTESSPEKDVFSSKVDIPTTKAQFREKFSYQTEGFLNKALTPYVDEGKRIPKGTQVVPFKGEAILDAKKRIGNAINRGEDILPMQNAAFVSHCVNEDVNVPDKLGIQKQEKETFADAVLRVSSQLNNAAQNPQADK